MKHDAWTGGVICINRRHFKLELFKKESVLDLANFCWHQPVISNVIVILILSKGHQFGWSYSEGISKLAIVLHQVEASDLVMRGSRGDMGKDSAPWPF